ncbi:MAG: toll/interleukin-1 receptor domain-containing protein [Nitrosospira sp.]
MPRVFLSYSHADESFREKLEKQLAVLKRQGVIDTYHDHRIAGGENFDQVISDHINNDEIILLLISPDFFYSDYCYNIEMKRAMERYDAGEAIVIPVILRACEWHSEPFGKLKAVPRDGKPISQWPDVDEANLQVARAVREAVNRLALKSITPPNLTLLPPVLPDAIAISQFREPRSSNLRIAKTFTQREKDRFKLETFEFMALFFDNSLAELGACNPDLEGTFRRIDANRFYAAVYRNGKDVARCTVYIGDGVFGDGICYVNRETTDSNTMNDSLRVEGGGDQALFLTSSGMASLVETLLIRSSLRREPRSSIGAC